MRTKSEKKQLSNKQRKQSKRLFARLPHSTRPFTPQDYEALPKGEASPSSTQSAVN